MAALLLLVACLAAGIALRFSGRLGESAPAAFNAYVVNVALPALALYHVHRAPLDVSFLQAALTSWVMLGVAGAFFALVARRAGLEARTIGALVLTGGLANTSFVGLPMIEAHIGAHGMPYGIVIDQLGSYLALSTVGVMLAASCSGERATWRMLLRRVLGFPPFIALALALALRPVSFAPALDDALARLGATVAPIALLSVGCQLRFGAIRERARALVLGLGYKLILGPLAVLLACVLLWQPDSEQARLAREIAIFEAAMGPMIGAAVVASNYRLDAPLASLMVGLGIPLSLLSAPLWLYLGSALG
jgi:malate permease and related proteins